MKVGAFYEHQIPRPWGRETEHKLFKDALDEIELCDRLGFGYIWATEHHFLEEYAHSSAPEVFLAACSQRTKQIRLAHGIVQMAPLINHPARVAERIATLDLVSDGRVDFGTGEGATNCELNGFHVTQEEKREAWLEGLTVVTRMMVEEPFLGHQGKYLTAPVRNIVPKPYQRPHPPLWLACSRRESILLAARLGLGALTFSFVSPDEAQQWVHDYYTTLENECEPIGYAVNPQIAIMCPLLCDRSEARAREIAAKHHGYFMYGLGWYAFFADHEPGKSRIWESYEKNPEAFVMPEGKIRDCVGTPDQIRDRLRDFEASGVDQVVFLSQAGKITHEVLSSSFELFGTEVLPEFIERDAKRTREKAALIERLNEKLMKRKPKPRIPDWGPTIIHPAGHH
jgi:alkanesulfonate monooxygenase SsuD/methylene tetrahydromethanopterin reductase-like flavin-dependent oxidoreductase (luciferase family)